MTQFWNVSVIHLKISANEIIVDIFIVKIILKYLDTIKDFYLAKESILEGIDLSSCSDEIILQYIHKNFHTKILCDWDFMPVNKYCGNWVNLRPKTFPKSATTLFTE